MWGVPPSIHSAPIEAAHGVDGESAGVSEGAEAEEGKGWCRQWVGGGRDGVGGEVKGGAEEVKGLCTV